MWLPMEPQPRAARKRSSPDACHCVWVVGFVTRFSKSPYICRYIGNHRHKKARMNRARFPKLSA